MPGPFPSTPQRPVAPTVPARQPGLDRLRAVAILLVVLLHCAVPYLVQPMPGLAWPTHDTRPALAVDGMFWWIESFIMPLFFLVSGYFAAVSLERYGAAGLIRQRLARLGKPLLWGCVLILPLEMYTWMTGWLIDGRITARKMRSLKLPPELSQDLWGLSHLWYLQYLLILCGLLALWQVGKSRWLSAAASLDPPSRAEMTSRSWWGVGCGSAAVCSVLLFIQPEVVTGFQHGFLPFPIKLLHSALFFSTGVLVFRSGLVDRRLPRTTWLLPLLSFALFIPGWSSIHAWNQGQTYLLDRLTLAALLGPAAAFAAVGWFAIAAAWHSPLNKPLAWLAGASFTVYLVHHPLAGLSHVALMRLDWPGWAKFVVSAIAVTISSCACHLLVERQARRSSGHPENARGITSVTSAAVTVRDRSAA